MVSGRVALLATNVAACAKAKSRGWSPEDISQPDVNPLGLSPDRCLEVFLRCGADALSDLSRYGHCAVRGQLYLLAVNAPSLGSIVLDATPLTEFGDGRFQEAMARLIRDLAAGTITEEMLGPPQPAETTT